MKRIKKMLRDNSLTKKIYLYLYELKYNKECKKKKMSLQRTGVETIRILQDTLENSNIDFFFDMGTLLGVIREGKLLKHDMDIDIAVMYISESIRQQCIQILTQVGCIHKYAYYVDAIGIVEDSFIFNGIKFDINYYYQGNSYDVCYLGYNVPDKVYECDRLDIVELRCTHIEAIKKVLFEDFYINVPREHENYLKERYGENWKIPDPNYVYWKGPSASAIQNSGLKKKILAK